MTIFIFTLAIHNSFTPWTFECMRDKKYISIGNMALKIETGIGIACFCFSLFAPELIYILGGDNYMDAIWIVPPVAMSILFQTIYTFFGNIEFYFEKTKFVMFASFIVAILNIVLNAIFIPIYGFIAAGYTTLFCYIIYSFVHYLFMLYICKQNGTSKIYNGLKIWFLGVLAVLLSLISLMLYFNTIIRYIIIFFGIIFMYIIWKKFKKEIN